MPYEVIGILSCILSIYIGYLSAHLIKKSFYKGFLLYLISVIIMIIGEYFSYKF